MASVSERWYRCFVGVVPSKINTHVSSWVKNFFPFHIIIRKKLQCYNSLRFMHTATPVVNTTTRSMPITIGTMNCIWCNTSWSCAALEPISPPDDTDECKCELSSSLYSSYCSAYFLLLVKILNWFSVDPAGLFARILNSYNVSASSWRMVNRLDVRPMLFDTRLHVFAFEI